MDPVFIERFSLSPTKPASANSAGSRVAVKDLIDIAGHVTSAGCSALAEAGRVASQDATCFGEIRKRAEAGEITVVGKTNLNELAFGATGINTVFGTPPNPLDADRMPGGSSSGSAVAVATGEADIALGSDTGGSIRIPAACCGVVGLKTTWSRIPTDGVWGLAPFLDTVGPMARTVADVVRGMDLLEPGFAATLPTLERQSVRVGRARPAAVESDPAVDGSVDAALLVSEFSVSEVSLDLWDDIQRSCLTVLLREAWEHDKHLLTTPNGVTTQTAARLALGAPITDDELREARAYRELGRESLRSIFEHVDVIVLPTLPTRAPLLNDTTTAVTAFTRFANLLGLPAIAVPVPVPANLTHESDAHLPASVQLIGPPGADALICAVAALLEKAVA